MLKRNLRSLINSTAMRLILAIEPGEEGEAAPAPAGGEDDADPPEGETPPAEGETPPAAAAEGEEGDADPDPKPARVPWHKKRIDKLTAENRQAAERAEAAERERDEARQRAAAYEALYGKDGATPAPAGTPPAGDAPRTYTDADVTERAAAIARTQGLNAKLESLFEDGVAAHGEAWTKQVKAAGEAFGEDLGKRIDFFEALADLPNATDVYHLLTADLDRMDEVLGMGPVKLGMELGRLSAKASAKPRAPGISRAPAPIAPIGGNGGEAPKDLAKAPMADFAADFERRRAARHEARNR